MLFIVEEGGRGGVVWSSQFTVRNTNNLYALTLATCCAHNRYINILQVYYSIFPTHQAKLAKSSGFAGLTEHNSVSQIIWILDH